MEKEVQDKLKHLKFKTLRKKRNLILEAVADSVLPIKFHFYREMIELFLHHNL